MYEILGWEHSSNIQIYTPEALKLIEKYWWKVASILWQYQNGNWRFLLPFSIIEVVNGILNLPKWIQELIKKQIFIKLFARASWIWDQNGLVGVLKSILIDDNEEIISTLEEIIKHWKDEKVLQYAKKFDWNNEYQGISSIHLSEKLINWFSNLWSIVEHPDYKWYYIVDFEEWEIEFLIDSEWNIIAESISTDHWKTFLSNYMKESLNEIVKMKIQTDNAWFINWKTSQTEFALLTDEYLQFLNWEIEKIYFYTQEIIRNNISFDYETWLNSKVIFLQQREFRDYSRLWEAPPQYYKFNTFWEFPTWKILEIYDSPLYYDKVPQEDFILILSKPTFTTNLLEKSSNIKVISAYINSPYLKWIKFDRWFRNWWLWSLWHGSYRYLLKGVPVITK